MVEQKMNLSKLGFRPSLPRHIPNRCCKMQERDHPDETLANALIITQLAILSARTEYLFNHLPSRQKIKPF